MVNSETLEEEDENGENEEGKGASEQGLSYFSYFYVTLDMDKHS